MEEYSPQELIDLASQYLHEEPDACYRQEIEKLLSVFDNDEQARLELIDRLVGFLQFGTAGLRAKMQAGYRRFNRVSISKAAFAVGQYLHNFVDPAQEVRKRGVVIAYDARRNSHIYAEETASVLAGLGFNIFLFPDMVPTPLCAFAVTHLNTAMGIMITASHNPALDNGFKVYGGNGAQIVMPVDLQIEQWMKKAPPYHSMPHLDIFQQTQKKLRYMITQEVIDSYFSAIQQFGFHRPKNGEAIKFVYTPLHGVGKKYAKRALEEAGFTQIEFVKSQSEPDGNFPTVAFPNPEEADALNEAIALANEVNADLVLANDPDADRLAVLVRNPKTSQLQSLSGNDVGILLGFDAISHAKTEKKRPLVISTLVSSRMLSQIAVRAGADYTETLTGFSKIAHVGIRKEQQENVHFIFGYEEALGYCVGNFVRDKDGICAAVRFMEMFATLREKKQTVFDALDAMAMNYGLFRGLQWSIRFDGIRASYDMQILMKNLRNNSNLISSLGGEAILTREDFLEKKEISLQDDILVYSTEKQTRLIIRPSGTEPKVKFYLETIQLVTKKDDLNILRIKTDAFLKNIQTQITTQLQLP
jgi:phosphomannomutase